LHFGKLRPELIRSERGKRCGVIQTTLYFDDFYDIFGPGTSKSNPGITFAWFKGEFWDGDYAALVRGDEINRRSQEVRIFLQLALSNSKRRVGKGAQRCAHVSFNANCKSAVGTLRFAHPTLAIFPISTCATYRRAAPAGEARR